ncbi:hypothetical protein ACIRRA_35235 [Nocardia sp. NPDC101769]|uniref:hypothetical protein n=1 Tax=Nocardia sp. NPDC101769 TaxID=3364333 RepID=UPI0038131B6C
MVESALLSRIDLSADDMTSVTSAVDGHLIGAAPQLAEEPRMRDRTGLRTDEQRAEAATPIMANLLGDDRYPAFRHRRDNRTSTGSADPIEGTPACLLDGITARLSLPK